MALALPVLIVVVLVVAQVLIVGRDQLIVEITARQAARAASVSADPTAAARRTAAESFGTRAHRVEVTIEGAGVTAIVTATSSIIGRSIELTARATMPLEPP